jgi:hypothetical protein
MDSKILHTWSFNFMDLEKWDVVFTKAEKNKFRIIHPLLLNDGSIIIRNMYGPLISVNLDSKINWVLKGNFNHSLELDADGDIWVPNIIDPPINKINVIKFIENDALTKVSQKGILFFQKSVENILIENGYRGLLLGVGSVITDQIHLNDIQPALTTTKYWNKGDLLISLRNLSTVFLYRPFTNKILWLKTGPWLNQHDVDFIDSTKVGVFGNNLIRTSGMSQPSFIINEHNEEYIYDFATDKISKPYSEFLAKSKVETPYEGRSDVLENGDLFVDDTKSGRLLRGNKEHEIWSLVDRIDDKTISMLGWCRYISKKEFDKKYSKINFASK